MKKWIQLVVVLFMSLILIQTAYKMCDVLLAGLGYGLCGFFVFGQSFLTGLYVYEFSRYLMEQRNKRPQVCAMTGDIVTLKKNILKIVEFKNDGFTVLLETQEGKQLLVFTNEVDWSLHNSKYNSN